MKENAVALIITRAIFSMMIFDDVWYIEEERGNSERLVAEFQCEGKKYKENENKRQSTGDESQSSDVKRFRADQQGSSVPLKSGPRGQYSGHYDRGGFQGNHPAMRARGASSNVPFRGPPLGSAGGPGRPFNYYGLPQGHGRPGERYGAFDSENQKGYNDYEPPRGPYDSGPQNRYSDYGPSYRQQESYRGIYGHTQGHSFDYSQYQPPSSGDSYSQPASAYGQQYGQYYGGQNNGQSYPRDYGYYAGGGQAPQDGRTDPHRYGGGY